MMFSHQTYSKEDGLRLTFKSTLGRLRIYSYTPEEIAALLANHSEMRSVLKGCRDALDTIPERQNLGDSAINRQIMRAERVLEVGRDLVQED